MAITDLTNTIWYLKENLDFTDILLARYTLTFKVNGNNWSYEYFYMDEPHSDEYQIKYGSEPFDPRDPIEWDTICTTYPVAQISVWTDQAYRKIKITGGSDATNANLIAFFTQNQTPLLGNVIAT